MFEQSLRFRLLGAAAIIIFVTLQVAGAALIVIFERNVIRTVDIELDAHLNQLASLLAVDRSGKLSLTNEPADPRFLQPFAGRYWQVSSRNGVGLRSRSLWDVELTVRDPPAPGNAVQRRELVGPEDQILRAAVLSVVLGSEDDRAPESSYLLVVAMDRAEIRTLRADFALDVFGALGILGALLIAAGYVQVYVGLRPFEALRNGLELIRVGTARRLATDVPSELQPLVAETNNLLDAQERAIAVARERAGNLAHGFKTPLTALSMLSERLRRSGKAELAEEIDQQIRGLDQHVERELARSRIAAEARTHRRTPVEPIVAGLVRTMRKLPRGDDIQWHIDCPPGLSVSVDEVDLSEILGNLLDNARKWTGSEVKIGMGRSGDRVKVNIEDDGPGLPPKQYGRAMERGGRLDEAVPGSGLGLAIANEIIEAYEGKIELHKSVLGGLKAQITLPAAS